MSEHAEYYKCYGAFDPKQSQEGNCGFNLYASLTEHGTILKPSEPAKIIDTGLVVKIPYGYCGKLYPRKQLAAKSIHLSGTIIDPNYNKTIRVILQNLGTDNFIIDHNAIAQLLIEPVLMDPKSLIEGTKESVVHRNSAQ